MTSRSKKKDTATAVTKTPRAKPTHSKVYLYRRYGEVNCVSRKDNLPDGARFVEVTMPYNYLAGPAARVCIGKVNIAPENLPANTLAD
jgi:hypothetical protein